MGEGTQESSETRSSLDMIEDHIQLNLKAMFDRIQNLFEGQQQQLNQIYATQAQQNTLQLAQLNNVALNALNNAVDTANMVSKQAVRHADVAIDSMYNVPSTDAIAAATASGAGAVAEKAFSTINPNIPGNLSSPASPAGGSQTTGG